MRNWKRHSRLRRPFVYLAVTLAALLAVGQPGHAGYSKALKKSRHPASPVGKARLQTSTAPEVAGQWETANGQPLVREWPLTPVHINLLPDGRVLFWSRDRYCPDYYDVEGSTRVRVWNPEYPNNFKKVNLFPAGLAEPTCPGPAPTPAPSPTPTPETNIFCSGHSFLPDGRLFVAGGHEIDSDDPLKEGLGSRHTNIFDYRDDTWKRGPDMNNGRWYPFNVTLASGETLIVSGTYYDSLNTNDDTPQNDVPEILDLQGQLRDFSPPQSSVQSGQRLANYPFLHLLPDGKVMALGKLLTTDLMTPSSVARGGTWQQGPSAWHFHQNERGGSSVQYAPGKVLLVGGPGSQANNSSTSEAEVYDFTQTPAPLRFRQVASMSFPRKYPTTTLLPDGKVLVTGGTSCFGSNDLDCGPNGTYGGAVKNPELWNPATETWQVMAPHQEARVYHSVALLLPDARVLVGGGGLPGAEGEFSPGDDVAKRKVEHKNVEIFSPPYLFHNGQPATRPVITHAPKEVAFGQSFQVGVGTVKPNEVAQAVLVRLGAVTHGFNQDQRRVQLAIAPSDHTDTLTITAPADGKAAPPGHYMLFLLKSNGDNLTPSVAKIVRVGKLATAPISHVFPADPADQGVRTVSVSAPAGTQWTATSDADFISVSTTAGTGSGTLTYTVADNNTTTFRGGKITLSISGEPVFDHVINVYQGKSFGDVPTTNADYDDMGKLSALQITSGCDPSNFCPTAYVTRAQMAIFFVRAMLGPGVAPPTPGKDTFADVEPTELAYPFIEEFTRRGITKGCDLNGPRFCPFNNVTRAELAAFAVRALGIKPRTPTHQSFPDVDSGHPFYKEIEEAYARGLMPPLMHCPGTGAYGNDGGADGTKFFSPDCRVTRAEMADLLVKLFRL